MCLISNATLMPRSSRVRPLAFPRVLRPARSDMGIAERATFIFRSHIRRKTQTRVIRKSSRLSFFFISFQQIGFVIAPRSSLSRLTISDLLASELQVINYKFVNTFNYKIFFTIMKKMN